jgi:hypothetical protein
VSAFAFVVDVFDPVAEDDVLPLLVLDALELLKPEPELRLLLLSDLPDDIEDEGELEVLPDKFDD